MNDYEEETKFTYNTLGLLERSEVKGVWPSSFDYNYVFRKQLELNEENK